MMWLRNINIFLSLVNFTMLNSIFRTIFIKTRMRCLNVAYPCIWFDFFLWMSCHLNREFQLKGVVVYVFLRNCWEKIIRLIIIWRWEFIMCLYVINDFFFELIIISFKSASNGGSMYFCFLLSTMKW